MSSASAPSTPLPRSRVSLTRALTIGRHEFRILFGDPSFIVIMLAMPIVVMAFIHRVYRLTLLSEGYRFANGSEQSVPGVTVMFTFFMMGSVGFAFFREHGWGTWERLRASHARPLEIMAGKVIPVLCHAFVQQGLLFGLGVLVFGLEIRGSVAALSVVAVAFSLCLVALGILLTALTKTANQQNAITNVGTMLFAGLGGALAPISALPGWARAIAPATPSYWAMRGFRSVLLDAGGVPEVMVPTVVLLAFTALLTIFGLYRFRFEETKLTWA